MCSLAYIGGGNTCESAPRAYSMCVKHLFYSLQKRRRGVSLKVAFFSFSQQTSVRMRPFTECVLTSSRGACAVLNISVCAKSFANKAINRQKVEVTTSGANTGSCRRELHLPPHSWPPQELIGSRKASTPRPTSLDHSRPREGAGRLRLARVVTCVSLSFPAATAARRRNKETDINKTKLKAIIV